MKKLMKLRHKKGFTLVELIIVVAIIAVLMAAVAAFTGPVQQIVQSSAASADALQVNKIIGDYIENRLAYASYIDVQIAKDVENLSIDNDVVGGDTGVKAIATLLNSTTKNPNGKGKGGMLIFHYEPDVDEPYRSSYEIYDIPITKSDFSGGNYASGLNSLLFNGSNTKNGRKELNGAVFADSFYLSRNQLLILPETSVVPNQMRNSVLMRLDILGYTFDEDYYDPSAPVDDDNRYIKPTTLSDYYKEFFKAENLTKGTGASAAKTAVLNPLSVKKSGTTEGVAFQLRNVGRDTQKEFDAYGTVSTDKWNVHGQDGGKNGKDIVIFYYIPVFSVN